MSTTETATGPEPLTFTTASRELTGILTELESDRLDVDDVVTYVRRATELITFCRDRIGGAKLQVSQLVADLTDSAAAPRT